MPGNDLLKRSNSLLQRGRGEEQTMGGWNGWRGFVPGLVAAAFCLQGPPSVGLAYDIDGGEHRRQPDGYFHLRRSHAITLVNQIGWYRIA